MQTEFSGPLVITGNLNSSSRTEPEAGPSPTFQGSAILDPRLVGTIGAAKGLPGYKVYSLFANGYVPLVDAVPITATTTRLAAAQATTASTAMTLVTTQGTGVSPNIPLVPFGSAINTSNRVTTALALDFGMCTCNTTAASAAISGLPTGAWKFFKAGQAVIISGAGSSATTPLIAKVLTAPAFGATTMTLDTAAGQSVTGAQIGNADPNGISAWPWVSAGTIALADPSQMLGRAVSISGNAGSSANNVTIVGYDAWGNYQSEVIAFAGGAVTTNGKKAFKYIVSATPDTTDAGHLVSVGTTDIFGLTLRSDYWEYLKVFWNGAIITASTGYVAAVDTSPATTTTGDSRGTYAVQSASDASKRLVISWSPQIYNLIDADNISFTSLFGVTPA